MLVSVPLVLHGESGVLVMPTLNRNFVGYRENQHSYGALSGRNGSSEQNQDQPFLHFLERERRSLGKKDGIGKN
ncbi:hypothetical protein ACLB1O_07890 [Escherichia coli]